MFRPFSNFRKLASDNDKRDVRTAALAHLTETGSSVRETARLFGLSKGAMQRLAAGTTAPEKLMGRPTVLPPNIEKALASSLEELCKNACSAPISLLSIIVESICDDLDIAVPGFVAGQAWQRGFFSRFPHLNVRLSKGQSRARLVNFNRISVADWYSHVEELVAEFEPEEIVNMDDVGFDLENIKERVRTNFAP